jgi:hypothetical protein
MDAISAVAFDISAAAAQPAGAAALPGASAGTIFDVAHFDSAYATAAQSPAPASTQTAAQAPKVAASENDGFRSVMNMLQGLNGSAESIGTAAAHIKTSQSAMTPADMLAMTTRAYEFLFHCELTSNVANRTSEGVQQLFQQQS